jgi:UrcA family protein
MSSKFKSAMTCALSVILFAAASPALASTAQVTVTGPSEDTRSTRVRYGDLDLSVARDRQRLDRRVDGAIKDVCGQREYHADRTLTARAPYLACTKAARTNARAAMQSAVKSAQSRAGAGGVQIADKSITVWARTDD